MPQSLAQSQCSIYLGIFYVHTTISMCTQRSLCVYYDLYAQHELDERELLDRALHRRVRALRHRHDLLLHLPVNVVHRLLHLLISRKICRVSWSPNS